MDDDTIRDELNEEEEIFPAHKKSPLADDVDADADDATENASDDLGETDDGDEEEEDFM